MSLRSEELDLIEKYVDNLLSKQEKQAFDELYRNDESFKKEADLQRQLITSLKNEESEKQREALLKQYQEFKARNSGGLNLKRRNISIISIAASVLILATFGILRFNQNSETLYDKYYNTYPGPNITRNNTEQSELLKAMTFYKQKEYPEALKIFDQLLQEESTYSDEINVLIGICYLEMDQPEESKLYFQRTYSTEKAFIGKWYVNMALLKEENFDQVIENLEVIANSNSPYRKKASELLEELRASSRE